MKQQKIPSPKIKESDFDISSILFIILIIYSLLIIFCMYRYEKDTKYMYELGSNHSKYYKDFYQVYYESQYLNRSQRFIMEHNITRDLFDCNGYYVHNQFYCVWTGNRTPDKINTTEYHEACHHLTITQYDHFCGWAEDLHNEYVD